MTFILLPWRERFSARVRSGWRSVAGPTVAARDAAVAEKRAVLLYRAPKGSGEIGPLPRCSSSNMPSMSFLLAPNSGPISLGPRQQNESQQALVRFAGEDTDAPEITALK